MVKVAIYVEGARGGKHLPSECRKAFRQFFEKAGLKGRLPPVYPCSGRQIAFDDFCIAVKSAAADVLPMLLVDSEDPVSKSPWEHLRDRVQDKWPRPDGVTDKQAQLMAQVMETWFLADRAALKTYFGQGFRDKALPKEAKIETIPKPKVFDSLKAATKDCKPKGEYGKGRDSFKLLGLIDPSLVCAAAPHANRLIKTLQNPES